MYTLYEMPDSGNCYKIRLLLAQLGTDYRRVSVNILDGESRTNEFLSKNPNGKIPLLEIDDGTTLPESNAILWYLAEGTAFIPNDKLARAQALQWMFFEQYSHEPYIATSRFWLHILQQPAQYASELAERQPKGYAALDVMERHLADHDYFVGGQYSIADIALYAYAHVAGEGGFDLESYPKIQAWLARVAKQPQHLPITA